MKLIYLLAACTLAIILLSIPGCITVYDQSKTDLTNPTFNFNISGTMDLGQLLGKINYKKVTPTPTPQVK